MSRGKQIAVGLVGLIILVVAVGVLTGNGQGGYFCLNNNPCVISGLWNFTGGLEVNGQLITNNSYYLNLSSYGAHLDGQACIGEVLSGSLNQVVLTGSGCAFNSGTDAGKSISVPQNPVPPPPIPLAIVCGGTGMPVCAGTGTLGNATFDVEVHYMVTYVNGYGEGLPSLEGAVLLPAGATTYGIQFPNDPCPTAINSSTSCKIYAAMDPAKTGSIVNGVWTGGNPETAWTGVSSGTEAFQGSQAQCSNGQPATGAACELDSINTGGAHPPQPNVLITTISTVNSTTTATIGTSASNPVAGNQISWGTPDDSAWTSASAALSTKRGGAIFVPAGAGCSYTLTGISFTGIPFVRILGAGPASGYLQSFSSVSAGLPYTPSGTSEVCTPAHVPVFSFISATAPHQLHAGFEIDNLAMTDISGVGNAQGCIYSEAVNHVNIQNSSCAFMTGRPAGTGSYLAGTNTGAYMFQCNADSPNSFCQFDDVPNYRGFYVNTGFEWLNGRSSEDKFFGEEIISASTGGGAAFFFACNGGIVGGGNDHFYGATSNYFPVWLYDCDRNADVVISRSENSYSPTYNIMGHTSSGSGVVLLGTGSAGSSCQVGILASGASESGNTVTLNINSLNVPSCIKVGTLLSVSNIAVVGYDSPPSWQVTAVSNGTGCSGSCGQIQYTAVQSGLATSGPGTALAVNTCQRNEIEGTMVNFHEALVVDANCESTMYSTLNAGGDSPRNEIYDAGTDSQKFTNLQLAVQAAQGNTPAFLVAPGAGAAVSGASLCTSAQQANGMCTDLAQAFLDVGRTNLFWHLDQFGNVDSTSAVSNAFQNGALTNDGTTGTLANAFIGITAAGAAIIAPTSSVPVGICTQFCGLTGNPAVAGPNSVSELIFDGAATINDYVSMSSSVYGAGHDNGSTVQAATGGPIMKILTASTLGSPPTLGTITYIAGTSSLPSGTYYASASCVNALGGESKMQSADVAVTLSASNTYDIQIQPPTCGGSADVGWFPYSTHAGQSSGSETLQLAQAPYCHTVSIYITGTGLSTACALTSNWAAGGIQTGSSPVGSSTDGGQSKVLVLFP
jgi:hypothetical protein